MLVLVAALEQLLDYHELDVPPRLQESLLLPLHLAPQHVHVSKLDLALLLGSCERKDHPRAMPIFSCILPPSTTPFPCLPPLPPPPSPLQRENKARVFKTGCSPGPATDRTSSLLTVLQIHGLCFWYNFKLWGYSLSGINPSSP